MITHSYKHAKRIRSPTAYYIAMSVSLSRVAESLDRCFSEDDLGQPHLSSHNYRTHPFNKDFFRIIPSIQSDVRLASVDGGNFQILGAPNFSVQLNRVYFNLFLGRDRILHSVLQQRVQFLSTTFATFRSGEVFYDTNLVPLGETAEELLPDENDLRFNSMDRRLTLGGTRADIGRVASIARRFAEWHLAKKAVENELRSGDVLVMDGTLRTAFKNEAEYATRAYVAAKSKGAIFSGLSKSSRLFTTTGLSLLAAIDKLAYDSGYRSAWRYYPIADSLSPEHEAAIFAVRLSEQARYIFRYEIQADQAKELGENRLDEILCQLSRNSCDLSFPGYPYILIDAHANAHVAREETDPYRIMLMSEVSELGSWPKLGRQIRSEDAHSILNALGA